MSRATKLLIRAIDGSVADFSGGSAYVAEAINDADELVYKKSVRMKQEQTDMNPSPAELCVPVPRVC